MIGLDDEIIDSAQTAFIQGRFILDGVVVLHEILNDVHRNKSSEIVFKVNFEKAYDKINWSFLRTVMFQKGFSQQWIDCVMNFVWGGKVAVKVNDKIGPYFRTYQGVRQDDPLSPLLFNLAVDALTCLVKNTQDRGLVRGLACQLVPSGCAILQYADDTIFLLEADVESARNLKFILCLFEQASGLKINFLKSDLYCLGGAQEMGAHLEEIFTCKLRAFPFKYLGIPLHFRRLANSDWKHVEERVEGRLASWQGKMLFRGVRLILINACLSSIPNYMMSPLEIPKGVIKKLDFFRKRLMWREGCDQRKIHLVNWLAIYQEVMNFCLLCKWLWRLETSSGVWQKVIRKKYCRGKPLALASFRNGDSHFWAGVMHVKDTFLSCCRRLIGNGKRTLFWSDDWIEGNPLSVQLPRLFHLTFSSEITVHKVFGWGSITFRRTLTGETLL